MVRHSARAHPDGRRHQIDINQLARAVQLAGTTSARVPSAIDKAERTDGINNKHRQLKESQAYHYSLALMAIGCAGQRSLST